MIITVAVIVIIIILHTTCVPYACESPSSPSCIATSFHLQMHRVCMWFVRHMHRVYMSPWDMPPCTTCVECLSVFFISRSMGRSYGLFGPFHVVVCYYYRVVIIILLTTYRGYQTTSRGYQNNNNNNTIIIITTNRRLSNSFLQTCPDPEKQKQDRHPVRFEISCTNACWRPDSYSFRGMRPFGASRKFVPYTGLHLPTLGENRIIACAHTGQNLYRSYLTFGGYVTGLFLPHARVLTLEELLTLLPDHSILTCIPSHPHNHCHHHHRHHHHHAHDMRTLRIRIVTCYYLHVCLLC